MRFDNFYKSNVQNHYVSCFECRMPIKTGETCFVDPDAMHRNGELCKKCKIVDIIDEPIRNTIRDEIDDIFENFSHQPMIDRMREIIREELKTIILEDGCDPNGPVSPN